MEVGDDAIASGGVWTYAEHPIPNMPVIKELTLERAQVVRLRARTFLKRSLKAEVSPPEMAVAAEEAPQIPLPVVDRPLVAAPPDQPARGVAPPKWQGLCQLKQSLQDHGWLPRVLRLRLWSVCHSCFG